MIKDENYFVVQGWMINRLNLKGTELLIYAIIYGFCQNEAQKYTGGRRYLAEFTGISSLKTITNTLNSLTEKGLLQKDERDENGVKFCDYRITPVGQNLPQGWGKNYTGGGVKITPHKDSIYINNNNYIKEKNINTKKENDGQTDQLKQRINALFNRRASTVWSEKELAVLSKIASRKEAMEELTAIESLYNSGYKYRRRDIQTFLNNWTTEFDRAQNGAQDIDKPKRFSSQIGNPVWAPDERGRQPAPWDL